MIELALRSGKIVSLIAREVYANDEFDVAYGLEDALRHKPVVIGDRGDVIAYYAVAKLVGGGHAFVVLSKADVEKIRKRSRAKDSGPWQTDYDAMAKKTCIRRLFTYLPSSVEMAQAIAQDEQVRTDIDTDALDSPHPFTDGPQVLDGEITGEVHDGIVVEDPDESAWPNTAQPADAR
jgi:recombination protein RecT